MVAEPIGPLLNEMLHALGQPLTALQTCRLLARIPQVRADENVLEEMANQIDTVTEIYQALRMVLETETGSRKDGEDRLDEIVPQMESRWTRLTSRRGIRMTLVCGQMELRCERERLELALDRIFEAVLSSVPDGATLRVEVAAMGARAQIVLLGGDQTEPGWRRTWSLRAAESLLGQIGGRVVYTFHPFCAEVQLCLGACHRSSLPAFD